MNKLEGYFKKKIRNRTSSRGAIILASDEELSSVEFFTFLYALPGHPPFPSPIYCVRSKLVRLILGIQYSLISLICNFMAIRNWGRLFTILKSNISGIDVSEDVLPFLDIQNGDKLQVLFPMTELHPVDIEPPIIKAFSEIFEGLAEQEIFTKSATIIRLRLKRKDHFVIGSSPISPIQQGLIEEKLYEYFQRTTFFYFQNIEEECDLTTKIVSFGIQFIGGSDS